MKSFLFIILGIIISSTIVFQNASAQEEFFASDQIELLEIELDWNLGGIPTDITEDGKTILLFAGCKDIALFDTGTNQIQHLNIPLEIEEYKCLNPQIHFSKSNYNEIFFVLEKNLYKFNLENVSTEKILEDVQLIDVIEDDKILFLYFDDHWNYLEQKHTVWFIDEQGVQPKKFLDLEAGQRISDVSSDGNKLLLLDVTEEYRDVDKFTSFVDVQSGDSFQIPAINSHCGRSPDFITNTELIVYTQRGCDQYPDESLYIADMNGNSEFIFWENAGEFPINGYLVSPDGKFLYFSIVGQGFYKMSLVDILDSDSSSPCSQVSEKTPIVVTTDKLNYLLDDDSVTVSICLLPEVYQKHMELQIMDPKYNEVYQTFDPGLDGGIWDIEKGYFTEMVSIDESFEISGKYTIEVNARGPIPGITHFGYGTEIENEFIEWNVPIPPWTKNVFVWYGWEQVTEEELINALQFLISEKIILVDVLSTQESQTEAIPKWIRDVFVWYGDDLVSDDELLRSLEFLIGNGIIVLN